MAQGVVIPYMKMDKQGYNPGELMELYMRFFPNMASMEGKTDGLLFVWPRVLGSKVDLHKTVDFNWYSKICLGKYFKTFASFSSKTFKCYMIKVLQKLIVPQLCFSRREEDWQDVCSVGQLMEEELTNHCVRLGSSCLKTL